MYHHPAPRTGALSVIRYAARTLCRLAVGAMGALALSASIAPAHATLDLATYNLNWTGYNGYSMTGTVTANTDTASSTVTENDIWDMSVSFYNPQHELLSTWTQVEGGEALYKGLMFSFDRNTFQVNQWDVNLGTSDSEASNGFELISGEGLELFSPRYDEDYSSGGTVTITPIILPPIEPPIWPPIWPPIEPPANTAPTLTYPTTTIVAEATSPAGAEVEFNVSASDVEDEVAPAATAMPSSGSTFHLGDTTVHVSATDTGGLTAQGDFTVHVQDTTAPVIYLNGDNCSSTLNIAVGSDLRDPGASAYDAVDQWVGVQTTGSVDTGTVGSYTLTYTAKDCHGNTSAPVTRTVNVIDPMPQLPKQRFDGGNYEGQADFNVSQQNNITGVINVAGHMYRAAFPLTQRNQTTVFRASKSASITANITVDVDQKGEARFLVQVADTTLELHPAMYSAKKAAGKDVAGKYTAVFRGNRNEGVLSDDGQQGPIGSGFATFTVARDGHVTVTGRTAEGTAMSGSSYLIKPTCGSKEGAGIAGADYSLPSEFHLYTGLYSTARRGNISGTFSLDRNSPAGSLGGEFRWVAPAGALVLYPHGIDTWGGVVGSRYEPTVPEGVLGLRFSFEKEDSYVIAGAIPEGAGTMSALDTTRTIDMRCRYTLSTGVLTGRGIGARSFQTIWLQEQGILEGSNTDGNRDLPGLVQTEQPEAQ